MFLVKKAFPYSPDGFTIISYQPDDVRAVREDLVEGLQDEGYIEPASGKAVAAAAAAAAAAPVPEAATQTAQAAAPVPLDEMDAKALRALIKAKTGKAPNNLVALPKLLELAKALG